ncbi:hypothetical protein Tco_0089849 [Tanacetum coccineum]
MEGEHFWGIFRLPLLGEDFFKSRITKARFKIISKEDKEHIVEKKIDVILPLQGEFASPEVKGSLDADEDIGVVVSSREWKSRGGGFVYGGVVVGGRRSIETKFQQSFRSEMYDCFRDFSGKFVRSGCTTALDVVPWETDGESVLRESC